MKTSIFLFAALLFAASLTAQVPEKMSYQAIVRNSSNALITNHLIGMKISILQTSASGTVVYAETQTPTTNANGLINIAIGTGSVISGVFSTINWSAGPYFIKTEIDPSGGTAYNITSTSELLSVPYALFAKESAKTKLITMPYFGEITHDSPAFQVSNNKGSAIVGNSLNTEGFSYGVVGQSWSNKGGSGVIGVNNSNTGESYGVSGHASSESGIGIKGKATSLTGITYGVHGSVASPNGFGVYGINSSSGTGVYGEGKIGVMGINKSKTGSAYGVQGEVNCPDGIAVSGNSYSQTGNTVGVYGITQSISGIGVYGASVAASGITTGVLGYINSPDGFSGYFTGGKFYVKGKVGVGTETPGAGIHLKGTGYPDSFMFIESATGNDAGFRLYEGTTAKWHIFNDVNAGGLRMYNTGAVTAIFCKQSNSFVGINTLTPTYNLDVNGTAGKTGGGSWSTSSDIRLKDVTGKYTKGLKEVIALQPVSFVYKTGNARQLPTDVAQIGFVAQEVQKVFPEAVTKGEDGYLDFNIHAINVALVNAIKELKAENEQLKSENRQFKLMSEKNDTRLTEIENTLRKTIKK